MIPELFGGLCLLSSNRYGENGSSKCSSIGMNHINTGRQSRWLDELTSRTSVQMSNILKGTVTAPAAVRGFVVIVERMKDPAQH